MAVASDLVRASASALDWVSALEWDSESALEWESVLVSASVLEPACQYLIARHSTP